MSDEIVLSVCFIVKNEEKVLGRILKQAKQFADEIIIVDTGSNDKTKEIAKKYTDFVFDFEWQDDFSSARNFSFDLATGKYLMWLDADDYISQDDIQRLVSLKNSGFYADVYMMKYQVGFDEFGCVNFEYYRERIVRNDPLFRWKGFVHEAITPQGKIEYMDIAIEHRKIEKDRDNGRNLRIYEKHLENGEILDPRSQFYYARELFFNNRIDDAIVQLEIFIKNKNAYIQNLIDAHLTLSKCYVLRNKFYEAKCTLIDSIKVLPPNAEICCALGEIYLTEGDVEASIFWYKMATSVNADLKSGAFVQKDYYDFIPYLQLSCLYYKLGRFEEFEKYHQLAKAIKPKHLSVIYNERFVGKLQN